MSETLSADDPYARTAQVYPKLPAELIARVGAYGAEELIRPGQTLFHRGDRRADFFLIVEGEVAITRMGRDGGEETLTVHRAGQFTGELDHVSARAVLVTATAQSDGRVIRVLNRDVSHMMASEPDLGEILMRAFILRRMGFLHHGQGAENEAAGLKSLWRPSLDVNKERTYLSRMADPHSLLNGEKFPVSREFRRGGRGRHRRVRCYSLHFGSGIEQFQSLGPDLFRAARACARGVHRAVPIFRSAERIGSVDGWAEASLDPAHPGKGRMT